MVCGKSGLNHLVIDPLLSLFQSIRQWNDWVPIEYRSDEGVIVVPAVNTLEGTEVVVSLHPYSGCPFNDVYQPVNRNKIAASKIDRILKIGFHPGLHSFQTVSYENEAAGLFSVSPDLDPMPPT